jgi:hypothetical protein
MVVISVILVKVTRGGKKPLLVELKSNFADGSGVVVPIPVCAIEVKAIR